MTLFEVFEVMYYSIVRTQPPPLPPSPGWWGGWAIFHCCLYRRSLGQIGIGILGGNWHFRWGRFFSGGTWKLPVQKTVITNLKQKNDSNCNFYNFSLLVPCPNKFLVICISILIFRGIYSPLPKYIFVGDFFFRVL